MSNSLGAGGLRLARGGVIGERCPPSPLPRGGDVRPWPPVLPVRFSSVRLYQAGVGAWVRGVHAPQRVSDG